MRPGRLNFSIVVVFVVAAGALAVDRTTGDETGPPYDDPLINQIAFFVLIGAVLVFVALCAITFARWIRARGSARALKSQSGASPTVSVVHPRRRKPSRLWRRS